MAHVSCNVMDFHGAFCFGCTTFPFHSLVLYHLFSVKFVNLFSFEFSVTMQTNRQAQAHQMLAIVKRRDAVSGAMFRFGFSTSLFVLFFILFILFIIYFLISKQEKGKIKGEGSIKTCGLSLKVSEAWVKGRESFFKFCFVLFMTDLGLDKRRPSVTLMFMYTQIVSSWVLSGNRVHVKAKLWAGDCYFKPLPSWNTWGFFFHFIGFICVQEKKWKRALFASFSFQWI